MIIAAGTAGAEFSAFVTFRIEAGTVKERQETRVISGGASRVARQLAGLEVDVLLISRAHPELAAALEAEGVSLVSGVELAPDAAVAAYLAGELFR